MLTEIQKEEFKKQAISEAQNKGACYSGPEQVEAFRLLTMTKGLYMEAKTGLTMSRKVSCYAIAKREFGLKGNKTKVFEGLAQICFEKTGMDLRGLSEKLKAN